MHRALFLSFALSIVFSAQAATLVARSPEAPGDAPGWKYRVRLCVVSPTVTLREDRWSSDDDEIRSFSALSYRGETLRVVQTTAINVIGAKLVTVHIKQSDGTWKKFDSVRDELPDARVALMRLLAARGLPEDVLEGCAGME